MYMCIMQVEEITKMAKERCDLAKAFIKAVEKPKTSKSKKEKEGKDDQLAIADGAAAAPNGAEDA